MNDKKDIPHIKVKGIIQYMENLKARMYTPFVITPDGGFYKEGEQLIPQWLFEKAYPLELLKNRRLQDDSLDGRAVN